MLRSLIFCFLITTNVYAVQDSCTAKSSECKAPVRNPKYYPETHCTCFTCEQGTKHEKILCTNDENEAGRLQARVEMPEGTEKKEVEAAEKGKSMSLTGWIIDQEGKTVFVNDKDKQAWNIENTDAVKGHEGHRVKIKAKLNEPDHSINVEKLSMLRKSKQTAEETKKEEKK
jgi:hypothetical protein